MNLESLFYRSLHLHPEDLKPSTGDEGLEKALSECFPEHLRLFPPFYRNLPRLYSRTTPGTSKIKGNFRSLPELKKIYLEKALQEQFSVLHPFKDLKIVIFTWAIKDGWGDYFTQMEAGRILKEAFPACRVDLITLAPEGKDLPEELKAFSGEIMRYSHLPIKAFSESAVKLLESADILLQMPTYFPQSDLLPSKTKTIGEYGSLDRAWFHPMTEAYAMGLNVLEKGVLLRTMPSEFGQLKHAELSKTLFGTLSPTEAGRTQYRNAHHFNLCYTKSLRGMTLYFLTLFEALKDDEKSLDIYFSDLTSFSMLCEDVRFWNALALLKIKKAVLNLSGNIAEKQLASEGKLVRFIHVHSLCNEDFKALIAASDQLVGCTGDGSISECFSAKKPFFYDPPYHKRAFVKDLIALSDALFSLNAPFTQFLQGLLPPPKIELEDQLGDWVSEDYLLAHEDFPEDLFTKAGELGKLMKKVDFSFQARAFAEHIQENYCFNGFLINLVKRLAVHQHFPKYAEAEKNILTKFYSGEVLCINALNEIQVLLSSLSYQ